MCQLLGMNCATPTDFNFSFRGFAKRGGETDKHEHGFGVAIYEGRGLRTFHDTLPAAKSSVATFVANYPIQTLNMMAHIRYATQGGVSLENVHPFQRELWGIVFSFSHNGEVPKYTGKSFKEYPLLGKGKRRERFYHPVGNTDSEAVFCAILNGLRSEFTELPTLPNLYETIQRFCSEIVNGEEDTTILNFLLGCGQYTLFAYSWPGSRPGSTVWNGLYYIIRRPPFALAQLKDEDYSVDFSAVTTPSDRVAVIATSPLTINEGSNWKEFKRGQLLMFDKGWGYSELHDCHHIEQEGRGLCSNFMPKESDCLNAYDTPALLRELVDEYIRDGALSVSSQSSPPGCWAKRGADLGCGSGFSGLAFRSCVENLLGVDISREMIDKAKERGCYDCLLVGDIESVLNEHFKDDDDDSSHDEENDSMDHCHHKGTKLDLVFACNVFAYIHDIRGVFQSVRNNLKLTNGVFAFSAEIVESTDEKEEQKEDHKDETSNNSNIDIATPPPQPVLQSCARYAHEEFYIASLATEFGFTIKRMKSSNIRMHNKRLVKEALYVMALSEQK